MSSPGIAPAARDLDQPLPADGSELLPGGAVPDANEDDENLAYDLENAPALSFFVRHANAMRLLWFAALFAATGISTTLSSGLYIILAVAGAMYFVQCRSQPVPRCPTCASLLGYPVHVLPARRLGHVAAVLSAINLLLIILLQILSMSATPSRAWLRGNSAGARYLAAAICPPISSVSIALEVVLPHGIVLAATLLMLWWLRVASDPSGDEEASPPAVTPCCTHCILDEAPARLRSLEESGAAEATPSFVQPNHRGRSQWLDVTVLAAAALCHSASWPRVVTFPSALMGAALVACIVFLRRKLPRNVVVLAASALASFITVITLTSRTLGILVWWDLYDADKFENFGLVFSRGAFGNSSSTAAFACAGVASFLASVVCTGFTARAAATRGDMDLHRQGFLEVLLNEVSALINVFVLAIHHPAGLTVMSFSWGLLTMSYVATGWIISGCVVLVFAGRIPQRSLLALYSAVHFCAAQVAAYPLDSSFFYGLRVVVGIDGFHGDTSCLLPGYLLPPMTALVLLLFGHMAVLLRRHPLYDSGQRSRFRAFHIGASSFSEAASEMRTASSATAQTACPSIAVLTQEYGDSREIVADDSSSRNTSLAHSDGLMPRQAIEGTDHAMYCDTAPAPLLEDVAQGSYLALRLLPAAISIYDILKRVANRFCFTFSLILVFLTALSGINILHSFFIVFFVVFSVWSRAAVKWWIALVIYAELVALEQYVASVVANHFGFIFDNPNDALYGLVSRNLSWSVIVIYLLLPCVAYQRHLFHSANTSVRDKIQMRASESAALIAAGLIMSLCIALLSPVSIFSALFLAFSVFAALLHSMRNVRPGHILLRVIWIYLTILSIIVLVMTYLYQFPPLARAFAEGLEASFHASPADVGLFHYEILMYSAVRHDDSLSDGVDIAALSPLTINSTGDVLWETGLFLGLLPPSLLLLVAVYQLKYQRQELRRASVLRSVSTRRLASAAVPLLADDDRNLTAQGGVSRGTEDEVSGAKRDRDSHYITEKTALLHDQAGPADKRSLLSESKAGSLFADVEVADEHYSSSLVLPSASHPEANTVEQQLLGSLPTVSKGGRRRTFYSQYAPELARSSVPVAFASHISPMVMVVTSVSAIHRMLTAMTPHVSMAVVCVAACVTAAGWVDVVESSDFETTEYVLRSHTVTFLSVFYVLLALLLSAFISSRTFAAIQMVFSLLVVVLLYLVQFRAIYTSMVDSIPANSFLTKVGSGNGSPAAAIALFGLQPVADVPLCCGLPGVDPISRLVLLLLPHVIVFLAGCHRFAAIQLSKSLEVAGTDAVSPVLTGSPVYTQLRPGSPYRPTSVGTSFDSVTLPSWFVGAWHTSLRWGSRIVAFVVHPGDFILQCLLNGALLLAIGVLRATFFAYIFLFLLFFIVFSGPDGMAAGYRWLIVRIFVALLWMYAWGITLGYSYSGSVDELHHCSMFAPRFFGLCWKMSDIWVFPVVYLCVDANYGRCLFMAETAESPIGCTAVRQSPAWWTAVYRRGLHPIFYQHTNTLKMIRTASLQGKRSFHTDVIDLMPMPVVPGQTGAPMHPWTVKLIRSLPFFSLFLLIICGLSLRIPSLVSLIAGVVGLAMMEQIDRIPWLGPVIWRWVLYFSLGFQLPMMLIYNLNSVPSENLYVRILLSSAYPVVALISVWLVIAVHDSFDRQTYAIILHQIQGECIESREKGRSIKAAALVERAVVRVSSQREILSCDTLLHCVRNKIPPTEWSSDFRYKDSQPSDDEDMPYLLRLAAWLAKRSIGGSTLASHITPEACFETPAVDAKHVHIDMKLVAGREHAPDAVPDATSILPGRNGPWYVVRSTDSEELQNQRAARCQTGHFIEPLRSGPVAIQKYDIPWRSQVSILAESVFRFVISYTDFLCYMAFFLNFLARPSVVSAILPFASLAYALIVAPRPSLYFWQFTLWVTYFVVVLKSLVYCLLFNLKSQQTSEKEIILFSCISESFFDTILFDLFVLVTVYLHRFQLRQLGLWYLPRPVYGLRAGAASRDPPSAPMPLRSRKESAHQDSMVMSFNTAMATVVRSAGSLHQIPRDDGVQSKSKMPDRTQQTSTFSLLQNFYNSVVDKDQVKLGSEYYSSYFAVDFIAFFVLLLSYFSIVGNGNDNFFASLSSNMLPGPLVAAQLLMFIFIVIDRSLYVLRSMSLKYIFHLILVPFYLVSYLLWFSLSNTSTYVIQAPANSCYMSIAVRFLVAFKLLYLTISALQLRAGYPKLGASTFMVFARRYGTLNWLLYTLYRAVPFVFELRALLDWTFSSTCLKLYNWLQLEDMIHNLLLSKFEIELNVRWPNIIANNRYQTLSKSLLGCAGFLVLTAVLFFPLLYYSSFSPGLTLNYASSANLELSLSAGVDVLLWNSENSTFSSTSSQLLQLLQTRPALQTVAAAQELVQYCLVGAAASTLFNVPIQTLLSITSWLDDENLPASLTWRTTVVRTEGTVGTHVVNVDQVYPLGTASRKELREVLDGYLDIQQADIAQYLGRSSSKKLVPDTNFPQSLASIVGRSTFLSTDVSVPEAPRQCVTLNALYSPFLLSEQNSVSVVPVTLQLSSVALRNNVQLCLLNASLPSGGFQWYWEARTDALYKYGNFGPFDDAELACFNGTVGACAALDYDSGGISNNTLVPPYALPFPSMVPREGGLASILSNVGIIALYTTFVLALGRVIRLLVQNVALRIPLEMMPFPDYLLELVAAVHTARLQGDYWKEGELFNSLLDIYRSQESLRRWSSV